MMDIETMITLVAQKGADMNPTLHTFMQTRMVGYIVTGGVVSVGFICIALVLFALCKYVWKK